MRLRWIAKEIGFERVILKNNKIRAYLPKKENFAYYKSSSFRRILSYVQNSLRKCKMIEKKDKLSIEIKDIIDVKTALEVCENINK